MLSMAPGDFVEPRGAAQYYLVLFGWALYIAAALTGFTRLLIRPLRGAAGMWAERLRGPVTLTAVLLVLYPYYKALGYNNVTSVTVDGAMLQSLPRQTLAL